MCVEYIEARILLAAPTASLATAAEVIPAAPTDLKVALRSGWEVSLAFTDNSVNEDKFVVEANIIYRDGTLSNTIQMASISGSPPGEVGGRLFIRLPTFNNTPVSYHVRASNAAGLSEPSNVVTASAGQLNYIGLGAEFFRQRLLAGDPIVPDHQIGDWMPEQYMAPGVREPYTGFDPGSFSAVYEGKIRADFSEHYTFYTASAGGIALTVVDPDTNRVLVDFDNLQAQRPIAPYSDPPQFQDVAGSADLEAGKYYYLRIRYSGNAGGTYAALRVGWSSYSTPPEVLPAEWMLPILPGGPKVNGVYVSGEAWPSAVRDVLQAPFGAEIGPRLVGPLAGTSVALVPWANVNQLTITFDRDVQVSPEAVSVRGAAGEYTVSRFSYDRQTYAATWTFDRPFGADRVLLALTAADVTGAGDGGQMLDGEWPGPSPYRAGDGVPGGDFHLGFDVLPGDVNRDGRVTLADAADVRRRQGTAASGNPGTGAGAYSIFADLNGSGRIDAADAALVRRHQGQQLPPPSPAGPVAAMDAASTALLRDRPQRRGLFAVAPLID